MAARNRLVTGEWLLVSSHGGVNFVIGNSPTADGTYQAPPGVTPTIEGQRTDTRRIAEAAAGRFAERRAGLRLLLCAGLALEAASRLAPSDPTAPYNLALLHARAGRVVEARRFAERALALDPGSPLPRALLKELSSP